MTATTTLFTMTLQDEAPAIGCGFRWAFVKVGRKWVYLLSPYTMRACRIRREVWNGLAADEVVDQDVITRCRAALHKQVERTRQRPTLLQRQALGDER